MMKAFGASPAALLLLLLTSSLSAVVADSYDGWSYSSNSSSSAQIRPTTLLDPDGNKLGAVASESSICSRIGMFTLQKASNRGA
jgi:gamma-glutamyltranspeptidase/glutathione hydrolase